MQTGRRWWPLKRVRVKCSRNKEVKKNYCKEKKRLEKMFEGGRVGRKLGWYMMSGVLRHQIEFPVGQSTESHERAAVLVGPPWIVFTPSCPLSS
jgi:hypothetical protein